MGKDATLHLTQRFEYRELAFCPHCKEAMPGQNVNEAWVEVPAAEGWVVTYRIIPSFQGPVVAEVRVFPDPGEHPTFGIWTNRRVGVPQGGVPARVLRALRLTDPIALFDEVLERWLVEYGEEETQRVFGRFGLEPSPESVPHRPGRSGRSDTYYVRWAAAYVDRIRSGSRHPVKDIAETPPVWMRDFDRSSRAKQEGTVRTILHQARRRGLLTSGPVGQSGGELTKKGLRLLRKLGPTDV